MAALTQDKDTPNQQLGRVVTIPIAAATKIFKGAMVSVNAAGFAIVGADVASSIVMGVADEQVDNTGAAGALSINVRKGVFGFTTLGTVVDQADVGGPVYISDDNNIEKIAGVTNNIICGVLDHVDADGVTFWVKMRDPTL